MDEIEHRWRSSELPQSFSVLRGRSLQIGKLHRHRVYLLREYRRMIEKALAQVREIPVRMTWGSNPLVDLNHMNRGPRHIRARERTQHHPWCVAAADRHDETTARGDGFPRLFGDDIRGSLRHGFRRAKHFTIQGHGHAARTSAGF
jgi:hypothetical protein